MGRPGMTCGPADGRGSLESRIPDLHRGSLEADTAAVQEAVDHVGERSSRVVVIWRNGHHWAGDAARKPLVYLCALMPEATASTRRIARSATRKSLVTNRFERASPTGFEPVPPP